MITGIIVDCDRLRSVPASTWRHAARRSCLTAGHSYIIGQNVAKRNLSVAVYNHYKRIQAGEKNRDDIELAPAGLPAVLPFAA